MTTLRFGPCRHEDSRFVRDHQLLSGGDVRQRRQTNIEYVQAISIRNKQLLEERS